MNCKKFDPIKYSDEIFSRQDRLLEKTQQIKA